MSDEETKPDERLDSLLRRWGAREAARQADVGRLAAPRPRRTARPRPVWRWMPLAASVALCAVAAALFFAAENGDVSAIQARLTRSDPADKKRIEKLESDLAALRAKLGKTEERLARTEAELAKEKIALLNKPARRTDNEIEALVKERVTEAVKQYEIKLDEQWRKSQEQLAEAQRQLDEAHKGRDQARVDLAEAKHRFAQEREQHEKERSELVKRVETLRVKALFLARMLGSAGRSMYLLGIAPGKEGYAARQHAARARRLLQRCAELRPKLKSAGQQKHFDRIEALLTRLDLLDVHDEAAVKRFRALLKRVDVMRTVQAVRDAEGAEQVVIIWSQEVRFVLTEPSLGKVH